ncbi:MAG: M20/M25/M40 family metallo-hydrolase [Candidatus Nitronauta litoralis]|uniref:M20/M25/M40 family metallo-hydrolase n=1 Tax=Candidatus Nitronauta litoralis TaxID=2705533 RepID=A0A7T0BTC5_9BACT|nr:MAG: M20/M25/M40 family metallo-hydrolase [Candidatus Nitronauta litoralis]
MKVAVIYNKQQDFEGVLNVFGMQNQEKYNPKTVEKVASALEKGGHNVRVIDGNINVIEQLQGFMPRVVQGEQPGMVFNMAYGLQGVSRYTHIPSLLEMIGVPYVGSSPAGHGVALDKVTTKVMVHAAGLPTAPYWVFFNEDQVPDDIPFPVITKPKMEAVSMGIQVIHDLPSLKTAVVDLVEQFKQPILVEKFIPGREFAVGLLGNQDPEIFPILEIDLEGNPDAIQSIDDKLKKPKGKICPANVDEKTAEEIRRLTRDTFRVLGIYDFCRVDFRMDAEGNLYILELNSMASLGGTGSYVHAAQVAGYTYETMVNRMLDVAVERYFGTQQRDQLSVEEPESKTQKDPLRIRLRSHLRGNLRTMEDDLEKMVDINSYVQNIEGVNSLGRWVSNKLGTLGFQRHVYSRAEYGNILYLTNHMEETNDILLICNLDNPVDYEDFNAFYEEKGRLHGTGVARGKGGLAVMLGALKALRYTRSLKRVRCGILLITDESLGERSSKPVIEEVSGKSNFVVGLNGAGLSGEIMTSCSGTMRFEIEINRVQNKQGLKASSEVSDPILFVSQKLTALRKLNSEEEGIFITITGLQTKGMEDQPAYHAALSFLARYRTVDQRKKLEERIRGIFETKSQSNIKVYVTKGPQRKPFVETERSLAFFEKVEKIAKTLEVRVKKAENAMVSCMENSAHGVPALDGFGPVTGGYGSNNEYVVRDSLIDRAVLLAYLIYRSSKNFGS